LREYPFRATPERHFPAVALAMLPALAYFVLIPLDQALAGGPAPAHLVAVVQSLRCLSNGFAVTSLLWASALAAMLDGRLLRAAGCLAIAAVCSLFGVIHSPLQPAAIAWPWQVFTLMPPDTAIRCQSPYHWATAYILASILLVCLHVL
jgi:adenine/guanine/hypoxanthine permease